MNTMNALNEALNLSRQEHGVLRFITAGSVDDGKSTLIGRLLFDSKGIFADQLAAISKAKHKRVAGDAIDQSLSKLIQEKYPEAQFSINMVRAIKERHASVSPKMDEVEEILPVGGKPTTFSLTEQVYSACYTIVPPTVQALQDLIATYDPEFQAKMRNNILLGGGGSQIRGLGRAIEKGLSEYGGGKVTLVEEPQFAGSNGALKIALDMPTEFWAEFRTNRELATQGMSGLVS